MRHYLLPILLAAEAVLCLAVCGLQNFLSGALPALLGFPFAPIGQGLRALSLSGGPGNTAAIVLYVLLSLLPLGALALIRRRRKLAAEDGLLALLSPVLFAVLYFMINPGLLGPVGQGAVGQAMLGGCVYSLLIGYLVLRVLRYFFRAETEKLHRCLSALLWALCFLLVYAAFGSGFEDYLSSVEALRAGNTGVYSGLALSEGFLFLRWLVSALPYVLDVLVIFALLGLLRERRKDRFSPEAVEAANTLSRRCGWALAVTVLSTAGMNLLQLCFYSRLRDVSGSVILPLSSVVLVLGALLLAHYAQEAKEMKDDNDLFI